MNGIFTISFPLFALIGLGFLAYRRHIIADEAPSALIVFVYYFLLPPFLIMKINDADFSRGLNGDILLAYYLAAGVVFLSAYLGSRRTYARDPKVVGIRSLAAIASNTGYLGFPIVVLAYGNEAILPGIAIVLLDNLIILLGGSLLLEAAASRGAGWTRVTTETAKKIARNPLIVSIMLGSLYVLSIGPIPKPLDVLGKTMADATLPCALFALGATLAQRQTAGFLAADRYQIVALKLVLHPLLAFLLARYAFDVPYVDVAIVVVMAAMPVSVNTFIVARRYDAYVKETSGILFATTCLSMFVVTALLLVFSQ